MQLTIKTAGELGSSNSKRHKRIPFI